MNINSNYPFKDIMNIQRMLPPRKGDTKEKCKALAKLIFYDFKRLIYLNRKSLETFSSLRRRWISQVKQEESGKIDKDRLKYIDNIFESYIKGYETEIEYLGWRESQEKKLGEDLGIDKGNNLQSGLKSNDLLDAFNQLPEILREHIKKTSNNQLLALPAASEHEDLSVEKKKAEMKKIVQIPISFLDAAKQPTSDIIAAHYIGIGDKDCIFFDTQVYPTLKPFVIDLLNQRNIIPRQLFVELPLDEQAAIELKEQQKEGVENQIPIDVFKEVKFDINKLKGIIPSFNNLIKSHKEEQQQIKLIQEQQIKAQLRLQGAIHHAQMVGLDPFLHNVSQDKISEESSRCSSLFQDIQSQSFIQNDPTSPATRAARNEKLKNSIKKVGFLTGRRINKLKTPDKI